MRDQSTEWINDADQLLVVGSSLATFSAFRLVRQKKDEGGIVGYVLLGSLFGLG